MKAELEKLASEVRQIREKSMRPRYAPELIARTVKLMENYELKVLAASTGIGKETLRRWQIQSSNMAGSKAPCEQLTFSPVLPEPLGEIPANNTPDSAQVIRLDFSYRDGRRMVLEMPATKTNSQDLLSSLSQEFFRGC